MTGASHDLARLGRALARAQDEELDRFELTTRERLLERPPAPTFPARARAGLSSAMASRSVALLAAAALLLVVGFALWRPSPVTFVVGDSSASGRTDEWLAAPASGALPIRFSDGSTVTLAARSRARVVATTADGATVVVERGEVEADVVHRPGTRWGLRVGPYELRVHGTHFSAGWDPEGERLTVELTEGALEVLGPGVEQGRHMATGTRLEGHAAERRVVIAPIPDAALATRAADTTDSRDERSAGSGGATPAAAGASGGGGAASLAAAAGDGGSEADSDGRGSGGALPGTARAPSWRTLFQAGRHREALARARAEGFERLCRAADAADLMALADTARFGGSPGHAVTALTALRARFPADGRAPVAAFLLGSIAFDYAGSYGDATRWFQTYLAEQPSGALAREAMGRLLEAAVRSGDGATARAAAARYLDAFPSGPHAEQAKRIVSGGVGRDGAQ